MTPGYDILWLPAHPSAGFVSMDRYSRELEVRRKEIEGRSGLRIFSPFPEIVNTRSRVAGRLWRASQIYFVYPLWVWFWTRTHRVSLVHILDHSFSHLVQALPRNVKKVITLHDVAPLREEETSLTAGQRRRFLKSVSLLPKAQRILSVSAFSAGELLAQTQIGVSPAKIKVLSMGVDARFFAGAHSLPASLRPLSNVENLQSVLSVGSAQKRKNLKILPEVFRKLRAQISASARLLLIRVGEKLPATLAEELRKILGTENVLELGFLDDDALAATYQWANVFFLPSQLEGFGLPILEALAAGCPVVSSDSSSLPEVGGDVVSYHPPDDAEQAADRLREVLATDEPERCKRAAEARIHADRFSWENHLDQLLEHYRAVLAEAV